MAEDKIEVDFAGGKVASSKIPGFKYFPFGALVRIAKRFELGIERYGGYAWNAISKNQDCKKDIDFVLERCGHAMHHAAKLKAILSGEIPDDGDDHAAALGWAAMFLCEATDALAVPKLNCSACGGVGKVTLARSKQDLAEDIKSKTGDCPACKGTGKSRL